MVVDILTGWSTPLDRGKASMVPTPIRCPFSCVMTILQGDAGVPDYPTGVPAAGWYTDPSDPRQERWWGGVEWTHDVRPLAAVAALPPAQPALANVPGGGINPFAAIDAQEANQSAVVHGGSFGATPASSFSSFNSASSLDAAPSFDTGSFAAGSMGGSPGAVSASWYDPSRRAMQGPPPTNGLATAGLILSIVGANVLGIILSVFALRKARGFEADGELPVGRKRARWGLGLGIASVIISILLTVLWFFVFQSLWAAYLEEVATGTVQTEEPGGIVLDPQAPTVDTDAANDGTYLRADYEQAIRDEYAAEGYPAPDSIVCPDAGSTSAGSTIVCTIVTGDLTETRTAEYFENGGYSISTTSFSQ